MHLDELQKAVIILVDESGDLDLIPLLNSLRGFSNMSFPVEFAEKLKELCTVGLIQIGLWQGGVNGKFVAFDSTCLAGLWQRFPSAIQWSDDERHWIWVAYEDMPVVVVTPLAARMAKAEGLAGRWLYPPRALK